MPEEISFKKLNKITAIYIDARTLDTLMKDFRQKNKSLLVPPLFLEFCIWVDFNDRFRDVIYVKYETPEKLHILHFFYGKKYQAVNIDFNEYFDQQNKFKINCTSLSDRFLGLSEDDKGEQARMVLYGVLAISDYMLYYRPDIEYIDPSQAHTHVSPQKSLNRKSGNRVILLKSKKKRYTILPGERPRKIDYHTPAWYVRGHYRRVGPNKVMRYIRPTIAHRKAQKGIPRSPIYRID